MNIPKEIFSALVDLFVRLESDLARFDLESPEMPIMGDLSEDEDYIEPPPDRLPE